jgi:PhnB protein
MAKTSTYLNFHRNTEEAFLFYKSVFGGNFIDGKINRYGDMPPQEGMPAIKKDDRKLVLHVALPITGGHLLMGSDAPESMGFKITQGNNFYISLHLDSRAEADKLFAKLSKGGSVEIDMQDMYWGDYYGSLKDKFGIKWTISYRQEYF